jgi:hypothetical protein
MNINGRNVVVEFMNCQPWYVTYRSDKGNLRTLWHRDTTRPAVGIARRAMDEAMTALAHHWAVVPHI